MEKGVDIFSLRGKTVLLTGATGFLGSAMAHALGEAGAHIIVNSRSAERGADLVGSLRAAGCSAEAAVFDVTDKEAACAFFLSYGDRPLNVLINNAYVGGGGSIEVSSPVNYVDSYDITVVAAHNLLTMALPYLRRAVEQYGDASVVNLASMYAMVSPDQRIYESEQAVNPPFYGAAKAALLQWTRYAACEFGSEGIRVNAISPGPFPSGAVQKANPGLIGKLSQKVPMGRVGMVDEIKGPTLFLASSASSFVNGANIIVDGGWTCW